MRVSLNILPTMFSLCLQDKINIPILLPEIFLPIFQLIIDHNCNYLKIICLIYPLGISLIYLSIPS